MGKVTGFMEFARVHEHYDKPQQRIHNYREFVAPLTDAEAQQQGARCMDCGTPFCHNGCPIHNVIPDFNDLVYHQRWQDAFITLNATNNFPEFTGRVCPALCEAACTLNINNDSVGIKSIERAIIEKAWTMGWVTPQIASEKSGKKVAVIGGGPSGLACAQQLARAGHAVTLYEKRDKVGGLLRYGIPDFKLDKHLIDRRAEQMKAEGVTFKTSTVVGSDKLPEGVGSDATAKVSAKELLKEFDAVVLTGGSEVPRDLKVPGRELEGIHYAVEFLALQNKAVASNANSAMSAKGKNVVVIGGGDTGSDCVGTSLRQGAKSVLQLELMPKPPVSEDKPMTWPYWPRKLRVSSSQEEGSQCLWSITTKNFEGKKNVEKLNAIDVEWKTDPKTGRMSMSEIKGTERVIPADLVLLAMGFLHPSETLLEAFGVAPNARGNAQADTETGANPFATNVAKVFAAGDTRRGQSLVVWAIHEGRECAKAVDAFLKK